MLVNTRRPLGADTRDWSWGLSLWEVLRRLLADETAATRGGVSHQVCAWNHVILLESRRTETRCVSAAFAKRDHWVALNSPLLPKNKKQKTNEEQRRIGETSCHCRRFVSSEIKNTFVHGNGRLTGPFSCYRSQSEESVCWRENGMMGCVGAGSKRWLQVSVGIGNPDLSLCRRLWLPRYIGPLNWFPERCCLTDSFDPAASPSFLHTTCKRGHRGEGAVRGDRGGRAWDRKVFLL